MEIVSALQKEDINSTTPSRKSHAVFHYFLSGNSKQDAVTTNAHSKRLISFLKDRKLLTTSLSTICENTDGCVEKYRCASANVPYVSYVSVLLHYNLLGHKCTWVWQRSCRWTQ